MRILGHRLSDIGRVCARRATRRGYRLGLALAAAGLCIACGKKGPPLQPFDLAPGAPPDIIVRRLGDEVFLQVTVPDKSARGQGPYSVDHLEIYAATVAPGAPARNRDLLKPAFVIAKIPVQPPRDDEEAEPAEADSRPRPGDRVLFTETIGAEKMTPQVVSKPEPPAKTPVRAAPAPAPAAAAVAAGPPALTRMYVVAGITRNGKRGNPSLRVEFPLLSAPAPPRRGPSASWNATSVTIAWDPPPSSTDEAPGVTYNVYPAPSEGAAPAAAAPAATSAPAGGPPTPLNPTPIATTSFTHDGAEPDKQQCFVVRSAAPLGSPSAAVPVIESAPSEPICVTPKDTFPPAAPKSVAAVASAGVINLIWDANDEADLAGYIVLRGDAPGGTLQPLMREPIKETRYADRTARPGVRYVYAVVAVDKAGNRSPASNHVEEAAR